MAEIDEPTISKIVGMLIQILHGEYSDTGELAVIQLAVLAKRVCERERLRNR